MDHLRLLSKGPEQTKDIADLIGQNIKGGEVIELVSDVGGGKTTFVKGLARGMGSSETVRSPSFALAHEYKASRLKLVHLDFYRLNEAGIMTLMLDESLQDPRSVVVVEWAGIIENVLPEDRLRITIKVDTKDSRELLLAYPESMDYLMKDLES